MLVFIIPLKSAKVSSDWQRVSALFENCVKSACNQTSNKFYVIVVCHEKPITSFQHPNLCYVQVDFPPPSMDMLQFLHDKGFTLVNLQPLVHHLQAENKNSVKQADGMFFKNF